MPNLIPQEIIERKIFLIRGQKVMIDRDIAELYGVLTKRLNEQVRRNIKRFPEDFMFQLTENETTELVANCDRFNTMKHSTVQPYAFTEQGVAMLSSVLNSDKAIQVNIQIMRTFTKLRQILATHEDIKKKLEEHDKQFKIVFAEINEIHILLEPPEKPKYKIGFRKD